MGPGQLRRRTKSRRGTTREGCTGTRPLTITATGPVRRRWGWGKGFGPTTTVPDHLHDTGGASVGRGTLEVPSRTRPRTHSPGVFLVPTGDTSPTPTTLTPTRGIRGTPCKGSVPSYRHGETPTGNTYVRMRSSETREMERDHREPDSLVLSHRFRPSPEFLYGRVEEGWITGFLDVQPSSPDTSGGERGPCGMNPSSKRTRPDVPQTRDRVVSDHSVGRDRRRQGLRVLPRKTPTWMNVFLTP